jgi:hypothetical protein
VLHLDDGRDKDVARRVLAKHFRPEPVPMVRPG